MKFCYAIIFILFITSHKIDFDFMSDSSPIEILQIANSQLDYSAERIVAHQSQNKDSVDLFSNVVYNLPKQKTAIITLTR